MAKRLLSIILVSVFLVIGMIGLSACDALADLGIDMNIGAEQEPDNNQKPDEQTPTHVHDYVSTLTEPTCLLGGYTTYACECGDTYTDDNTDPLGHDFREYVFDNNSTCTSDGTETAVCSRDNCSETDVRTKLNSTAEHVYTEMVKSEQYLKSEATCASGTVYYKSCVCGLKSEDETFEDTDLLPHPADDVWQSDETHHWKKSICECDAKVDYTEHEIDGNGACTVCEKLVLPTDGVVYTLSKDGTHYNVTGYTGSASRVKIAATYDSLPVTLIAYRAFADCDNVTNIELPDSITEIAAGAFYYCTGLKSIVIPESVTKIGLGAFQGCKSIVEITVPFVGDKVKTDTDLYQYPFGYIFGENTYNGSTATVQSFHQDKLNYASSKEYYIPNSLRKVTVTGGTLLFGAFYGCSNLSEVIIGEGVTAIGNRAFYKCSGLKNVTISEGVAAIGSFAFYQCSLLKEVVVPDSVTSIGEGAFQYCTSLAKITIPFIGGSLDATAEKSVFGYIFGYTIQREGNSSIGGVEGGTYQYVDLSQAPVYYFSYYYYIPASLKEVIVTGGSIGQAEVMNCTNITTFVLGDEVTFIGQKAFYYCLGLTEIVIGKNVTRIYAQAFCECTALNTIYYNGTVEEWNAVIKDASWNSDVPATEVICTDGVVSLV